MTWRDDAACLGTNPNVFYTPDVPVGRPTHDKPDPYAHARTICNRCPVQADCLTDAVTTGDAYGFRAGLTPDEIHAIIRKRGGGDIAKVCEWCAAAYTAGPKAVTRKYCGDTCVRAAQREASWQHKLRLKQKARGVA